MRKITLKQMLSHIVGNNKRVRICRSHWLFAFSLARTRAYTLEFYLFCCHICHRKAPKHCFSTSYQTNQPLLTKQSIIHSWWQQIKGVFSTVSPPLQTIFSFTERRMWQMWQQNKQNHWVIRARETLGVHMRETREELQKDVRGTPESRKRNFRQTWEERTAWMRGRDMETKITSSFSHSVSP